MESAFSTIPFTSGVPSYGSEPESGPGMFSQAQGGWATLFLSHMLPHCTTQKNQENHLQNFLLEEWRWGQVEGENRHPKTSKEFREPDPATPE